MIYGDSAMDEIQYQYPIFSNKNHEENGYKPFSWVFDGLV